MLGITIEEARPPAFDIWPENWAAVCFFAGVPSGAWNIGPGGPIGIRPEAYREIRLTKGVSLTQWRAIYDDLCVMEAAALDWIHRK